MIDLAPGQMTLQEKGADLQATLLEREGAETGALVSVLTHDSDRLYARIHLDVVEAKLTNVAEHFHIRGKATKVRQRSMLCWLSSQWKCVTGTSSK